MGQDQNKKKKEEQEIPPLWQPSWRWHFKLLCGIYVFLVIAYFAISNFLGKLPEPYKLREIPPEITPWLNK